jgi:hypothetical protein
MISAGLKRHQFEERHMANGIFPGLGVKFPEAVKREDAERWIELVESTHQGSGAPARRSPSAAAPS